MPLNVPVGRQRFLRRGQHVESSRRESPRAFSRSQGNQQTVMEHRRSRRRTDDAVPRRRGTQPSECRRGAKGDCGGHADSRVLHQFPKLTWACRNSSMGWPHSFEPHAPPPHRPLKKRARKSRLSIARRGLCGASLQNPHRPVRGENEFRPRLCRHAEKRFHRHPTPDRRVGEGLATFGSPGRNRPVPSMKSPAGEIALVKIDELTRRRHADE